MSAARRVTCRIKNYIQPFEHVLALRELEMLTGNSPEPVGEETEGRLPLLFRVNTRLPAKHLAERLAYWETVADGEEIVTAQVRYEASTIVSRSNIVVRKGRGNKKEVVLPSRRTLRYATHGVHEYRGKFFPQLVRASVNDANVPSSGIVADLMCGSGTTLVEAVISGRLALGLDMNPLSVFVSRVKCNLLSESADELSRIQERTKADLQKYLSSPLPRANYLRDLPDHDQAYLARWFSDDVLRGLDAVMAVVGEIARSNIRDFYRVGLSNIIRRVSWQKEDDLRVRKELKNVSGTDVVRTFLSEIERSSRLVSSFLRQYDKSAAGQFEVGEGDAKRAVSTWTKHLGKVDAVITSPPYATALPYIDTDRLSLVYLGLLPRASHRKRDLCMIGNREITEKQRKICWKRYEKEGTKLPNSTRELIERIESLNSRSNVGFRRRNLAALLSGYFLDMHDVLTGVRQLLKDEGRAYFVVGNNSTKAGGDTYIEIETASHLASIGESVGMFVLDRIDMDMLASRDIFRKNAMASEQIIVFGQG